MVADPIAMKPVGVDGVPPCSPRRVTKRPKGLFPRDIRSQRYRSLAVTGNVCKLFQASKPQRDFGAGSARRP